MTSLPPSQPLAALNRHRGHDCDHHLPLQIPSPGQLPAGPKEDSGAHTQGMSKGGERVSAVCLRRWEGLSIRQGSLDVLRVLRSVPGAEYGGNQSDAGSVPIEFPLWRRRPVLTNSVGM